MMPLRGRSYEMDMRRRVIPADKDVLYASGCL